MVRGARAAHHDQQGNGQGFVRDARVSAADLRLRRINALDHLGNVAAVACGETALLGRRRGDARFAPSVSVVGAVVRRGRTARRCAFALAVGTAEGTVAGIYCVLGFHHLALSGSLMGDRGSNDTRFRGSLQERQQRAETKPSASSFVVATSSRIIFLDVGRRLQLTLPARNAPCLCGSSKKYKKCCLPIIGASLRSTSEETRLGEVEEKTVVLMRLRRDISLPTLRCLKEVADGTSFELLAEVRLPVDVARNRLVRRVRELPYRLRYVFCIDSDAVRWHGTFERLGHDVRKLGPKALIGVVHGPVQWHRRLLY